MSPCRQQLWFLTYFMILYKICIKLPRARAGRSGLCASGHWSYKLWPQVRGAECRSTGPVLLCDRAASQHANEILLTRRLGRRRVGNQWARPSRRAKGSGFVSSPWGGGGGEGSKKTVMQERKKTSDFLSCIVQNLTHLSSVPTSFPNSPGVVQVCTTDTAAAIFIVIALWASSHPGSFSELLNLLPVKPTP